MQPPDATSPIRELVEKYLYDFPDEAAQLASLQEFLATHGTYLDQIRRSNMAGHLTVSGLIVDASRTRVLLVAHRTLGRRLQPGGHIEASDVSLLAAAHREISEETGLAAEELQLISRGRNPQLPVDINSHRIPASSVKGEAEHLHHDLRYLFVLTRPQPESMRSPEDGAELTWETFERAFADDSQRHLPRKLDEILAADRPTAPPPQRLSR